MRLRPPFFVVCLAAGLLGAGCGDATGSPDGRPDAAADGDLDGGLDGDLGDGAPSCLGDAAVDGGQCLEAGTRPVRVRTLAGSGIKGYADGLASTAAFDEPSDVAVDAQGRVIVADTWNHRLRVVMGGQVRTLAGDGTPGFADGPVLAARFNQPTGVAVDAAGRIYVADRLNNRIRLIEDDEVTTLAGDTAPGLTDGPLAAARFNWPTAVAIDGTSVLVADSANHAIRAIRGERVETVAGTGIEGDLDALAASATFASPCQLAAAGGTIYVADQGNHRLRTIAASRVKTLAGSGVPGARDGLASLATFNLPCGVAVDGGWVFVADTASHSVRLVRDGRVTTFAGNGTAGFHDGTPLAAQLSQPRGLAVFGKRLYVADRDNHRVRVIDY